MGLFGDNGIVTFRENMGARRPVRIELRKGCAWANGVDERRHGCRAETAVEKPKQNHFKGTWITTTGFFPKATRMANGQYLEAGGSSDLKLVNKQQGRKSQL